jgi:hypothetical protein
VAGVLISHARCVLGIPRGLNEQVVDHFHTSEGAAAGSNGSLCSGRYVKHQNQSYSSRNCRDRSGPGSDDLLTHSHRYGVGVRTRATDLHFSQDPDTNLPSHLHAYIHFSHTHTNMRSQIRTHTHTCSLWPSCACADYLLSLSLSCSCCTLTHSLVNIFRHVIGALGWLGSSCARFAEVDVRTPRGEQQIDRCSPQIMSLPGRL